MNQIPVALLLCLVLGGCTTLRGAAQHTPEGTPPPPHAPVLEVTQIQADIAMARVASEKILKSARTGGQLGVGPSQAFPETELTLPTAGHRKILFKETVTMICGPVDMASVLNRYAQALTLFDQPESEKIGGWLSAAQGSALALGAIFTFLGSGDNPNPGLQKTGAVLLGTGGIFSILQMTGLYEHRVVKEGLARVEFNRQFGMLLREYTPTIDAARQSCGLIRSYAATIPRSPTEGDIPRDQYEGLAQAAEQLGLIHEGIVKIGSAAGKVYDEMQQVMSLASSKVAIDLKNINDLTYATRSGWAQDQAMIQERLNCIRTCLNPVAP